jgi:hypothetical protein
MRHAIAFAYLATTVACGPTTAPELTGLTDQVAQVGVELKIELDGTDSTGDRLSYDYRAPDVMDLAGHASVTVTPAGSGVFRWTPIAADIGSHAFDFIASNGDASTTVTININVKSALGAATAPVFRQPLGTGTTIDLSRTPCVDIDVVVDDQAAANLTITQEDPVIDGAKLNTIDGTTAKWHWCPSPVQQSGDSRYTLVLAADDGQNPKTEKPYLIVLRNGAGSCPGSGPTVYHTAADHTTRVDLPLSARITDTLGLKDAPLLYYSTTDPGATPDVAQMVQITTTLKAGDENDGTWTANVPNPVASASDGTSATVYYVFGADDHDQANSCDHVTLSQVYSMVVTAGGSDTAGLCSACTADSQCGAGNECVYMGNMGASYCLQACGSGCPTGYSCSTSAVYSVDGADTNQCIPQSGSCAAPTGTCVNDSWEANDTQSEASANGPFDSGLHDLVSCPNPNSTTRMEDDWYKIVLPAQSTLDIYLTGDGAVDLDLHLYHSDGTVVGASVGLTDSEELHECLPGLTYYIKVNGYGYARDAYHLDYFTSAATSCP